MLSAGLPWSSFGCGKLGGRWRVQGLPLWITGHLRPPPRIPTCNTTPPRSTWQSPRQCWQNGWKKAYGAVPRHSGMLLDTSRFLLKKAWKTICLQIVLPMPQASIGLGRVSILHGLPWTFAEARVRANSFLLEDATLRRALSHVQAAKSKMVYGFRCLQLLDQSFDCPCFSPYIWEFRAGRPIKCRRHGRAFRRIYPLVLYGQLRTPV